MQRFSNISFWGYNLRTCFFLLVLLIESIFISGCKKDSDSSADDVYLCGMEMNSSLVSVAKYWKNGVLMDIFNRSNSYYFSDVFLSGSDVYIVGNEVLADNTIAPNMWKNGVLSTLSNENSSVTSVCVSNENVYAAGALRNGNVNKATYWKNGVSNTINVSNNFESYIARITVVGH